MEASLSYDKQVLLSDREFSSSEHKPFAHHLKASPTQSADKASTPTFSEDQYNDVNSIQAIPELDRTTSRTPKVRAMSNLKLAMTNIFDNNNNGQNVNRFGLNDLVRAAIHHLGDLFCNFNESLSEKSEARKKSANLSLKEHEHEYMDANTFVKFLEDKFSLYGYSVAEMNHLFMTLKPQTPLHNGNNSNAKHKNKILSIHFTEFNVAINQFYTSKFKSIFAEKTSFRQKDIHQLLMHAIKAKLQQVRKALKALKHEDNHHHIHSLHDDGPDVPPPINMEYLLAQHKIEQEQLRQRMRNEHYELEEDLELELEPDEEAHILHNASLLNSVEQAASPIFAGMGMSPIANKSVAIGMGMNISAHPIGISNDEMMAMVDTPISDLQSEEEQALLREIEEEDEEEDESSYDDESESDDEILHDNELTRIYARVEIGTHITFGETGVVIQCSKINLEHNIYEFHTPQTLLQDCDPVVNNYLYRLPSARSDDTDISSVFAASMASNGAASPLSYLSSSAILIAKDNPFKIAEEPFNDNVYKRQEYMYQLSQFFGGRVYLTTQQLRFVGIEPKLPDFMATEEAVLLEENRPISTSASTHRNRSGNIRDTAQINTEHLRAKGNKSGAKVDENTDLYDEDKKLASLLQSLCNMRYEFVPNGLLTHLQFIEFIDSLQIYNYDENVLKHMFRYIYTEELPPILPPPVVIEFNDDQEDDYNNVNGMYVAYGECIGYEYDEVLELINDTTKQNFDDLLTTMLVERLQNIYQTLKFDDLDAHPNQFLHREQSIHREQEQNKLNADELKENVFNYFDQQNIKNASNVGHRQSLTQNTGVSTMRSTASDTVTYHGMFRQSIISHDSLKNLLETMKKDKTTTPKLVHQLSSSTTTLTLHPQTPRTPISNLDTFEKYPALIDITDIPQSYHCKIHSLQSKLMKKSSLNALMDDDATFQSSSATLHKSQRKSHDNNAVSPSMEDGILLTNLANVDHFTPKEASDDDRELMEMKDMNDTHNDNIPQQPPVFVTSSSNDSSEMQIVSPNGTKRKKNHGRHSASRQPSLPTLPEEHIDANNLKPNRKSSGDPRSQSLNNDIDAKVDQLFATIGSDQVHIHLLKYGLRLIEVSLYGDEHYFLQILQTYAKHKYNANSAQRFFVHKDWIKQFLLDDSIPHRLKPLQRKIMTHLRRKSHLLVNELSKRESSYGTNSIATYASSEDTFTEAATHHSAQRVMTLPREVQQTYVAYFKQTLKSRAKALTQYTQTRYPSTHTKYWRDIFLFMSNGENYLDRVTFKEGIERCGIKIRTQKKRGKKKRNKTEIQQILNAVFIEMDFDETGYVTIHAFTNMMMAEDPPIVSSRSSVGYYSNRNSPNVYDVYSNYGFSETTTNPRKSYEQHAVHNHNRGHPPHYNYNYGNQYLSPHHATQQRMRHTQHGQHLSPYDANYNNNDHHRAKRKKRRKKRHQYHHHQHYNNKYEAGDEFNDDETIDLSSNEDREPPHIQQYYQASDEDDDIVDEKTHSFHENDEKYLNHAWNSSVDEYHHHHSHHHHTQHRKYAHHQDHHHQEEEQDEKIPMLDVLNHHEKQMKGNNNNNNYDEKQLDLTQVKQSKKKKDSGTNKKKKKKKKKKKSTRDTLNNISQYSFLVSRKKLSRLDLIIRRYYITIDAQRGCVLLSPLNECISEISQEFGLHQIIIGDHQSTTIQVKTQNGKHIYYEFDVKQAKDEFVDLLDQVKNESGSNNFNNAHRLPRGVGFGAIDHDDIEKQLRVNVSMFDVDDIDVDPIYDDECSVCRATFCTCSTFYTAVLLSILNIFIIYLYLAVSSLNIEKEEILLVWILINMIFLRLSAIQWMRTHFILLCSKIFDCIWCHKLMYYGFSVHSLVTIWCIFWLIWNTIMLATEIWTNNVYNSNTPQQIVCFGFIVLSLTFLVFAQFAYCRCRCCTVTLSQLLHCVLGRLACCFMGIYAILYCTLHKNDMERIEIVICLWLFSLLLITDFIFYFIFVCVMQKNQLQIDAKQIAIRVMSEEQCEVQIPFEMSPFEYIWISDDGATWMKVPILLTTKKHKLSYASSSLVARNKHIKNVETNPYHLPDTSSNEQVELRTISDFYKIKNTLSRSARSKLNQYEAVGQGRVIDGRAGGFIGSSIEEEDIALRKKEEDNEINKFLCCLMIHSRNKIGQRIIEKASHCFEDADFNLYIKKYDRPLTIMCFAPLYKRIGVIATDDRIIPAIAYLFGTKQSAPPFQYIDILWIVNKPKKQYHNLYQLLQVNKNSSVVMNRSRQNIKIVDMTKKKSSKEKQIASFIHNISSQAIFALTSRFQAIRIQKESKHAVVYIQHAEWY